MPVLGGGEYVTGISHQIEYFITHTFRRSDNVNWPYLDGTSWHCTILPRFSEAISTSWPGSVISERGTRHFLPTLQLTISPRPASNALITAGILSSSEMWMRIKPLVRLVLEWSGLVTNRSVDFVTIALVLRSGQNVKLSRMWWGQGATDPLHAGGVKLGHSTAILGHLWWPVPTGIIKLTVIWLSDGGVGDEAAMRNGLDTGSHTQSNRVLVGELLQADCIPAHIVPYHLTACTIRGNHIQSWWLLPKRQLITEKKRKAQSKHAVWKMAKHNVKTASWTQPAIKCIK